MLKPEQVRKIIRETLASKIKSTWLGHAEDMRAQFRACLGQHLAMVHEVEAQIAIQEIISELLTSKG